MHLQPSWPTGSVVTWGDPDAGGDSSRVQDQLRNVQQIRATNSAFAAILADGSLVTWGDPDAGGDSFEVQDQLTYLCDIYIYIYIFVYICINL